MIPNHCLLRATLLIMVIVILGVVSTNFCCFCIWEGTLVNWNSLNLLYSINWWTMMSWGANQLRHFFERNMWVCTTIFHSIKTKLVRRTLRLSRQLQRFTKKSLNWSWLRGWIWSVRDLFLKRKEYGVAGELGRHWVWRVWNWLKRSSSSTSASGWIKTKFSFWANKWGKWCFRYYFWGKKE